MDEPVSPPAGEPRDPYAPPPPGAPPRPSTVHQQRSQRPRSQPPQAPRPAGRAARGDALGWRALATAVFGLTFGALLWPWALLGIVLCVLGAWSGVRARGSARSRGARPTAATTAIVVGLAGTLLTTGLAVFGYVLHDELARYQECRSGANTTTAKQLCEQRLRDEIAVHTGLRLP